MIYFICYSTSKIHAHQIAGKKLVKYKTIYKIYNYTVTADLASVLLPLTVMYWIHFLLVVKLEQIKYIYKISLKLIEKFQLLNLNIRIYLRKEINMNELRYVYLRKTLNINFIFKLNSVYHTLCLLCV